MAASGSVSFHTSQKIIETEDYAKINNCCKTWSRHIRNGLSVMKFNRHFFPITPLSRLS